MEPEKFSPQELDECLRHYEIGQVRGFEDFVRGSHRSPKAVITTDRGKYLLKRRHPSRCEPVKIAFTHHMQRFLSEKGFPLPRLIPLRDTGETLLVREEGIYEMFEYVAGEQYDRSAEATGDAGRTLAEYHHLLKDFRNEYVPPAGSYHNAGSVHQAIAETVSSLPLGHRPPVETLTRTVESLREAYDACAESADSAGLGDRDIQLVHGDWHPGNMLFRERRVAAVVDYDSVRLQQRVIDAANGLLQFSILTGGTGPAQWPDELDTARLEAFARGYASGLPLAPGEIAILPHLMCEALIAEATVPIAATGSFGKVNGYMVLEMVYRKVRWIRRHIGDIAAILEKTEA